jgi:hypothetical protein
MADGRLAAKLDEIRARWAKIARVEARPDVVPPGQGEWASVEDWRPDVPRLLAAVDAMLGEVAEWQQSVADQERLRPAAEADISKAAFLGWVNGVEDCIADLRSAISAALLGSETAPAGEER